MGKIQTQTQIQKLIEFEKPMKGIEIVIALTKELIEELTSRTDRGD